MAEHREGLGALVGGWDRLGGLWVLVERFAELHRAV